MKLYYTPGACSLAVDIILREAGYAFDMEKVDLKTKKTESGADFNQINEKSAVPYLILENGQGLTEVGVILQYLADGMPESKLAPTLGSFERVRMNEWLNFIASEVHKSFFPFFAGLDAQAKEVYTKRLQKGFGYIAGKLQGKYLFGERFTIADAYIYVMLTWAANMKVDLSAWPSLNDYKQRIEAHPKVQEARLAEGLGKAAAA